LAAGLAACCALSASDALAGSGCGLASWYGLGGQTASGEYIDPVALTAAHRTLPFGTRVRVENLDNGRTIVVRINDRGPFIAGRDIDLTRAAAEKLDFIGDGVAKVRMTVLGGNGSVTAGGAHAACASGAIVRDALCRRFRRTRSGQRGARRRAGAGHAFR
jgi:rare lipoprotein A